MDYPSHQEIYNAVSVLESRVKAIESDVKLQGPVLHRVAAELEAAKATEEGHKRNIATFWETHWPALLDDIRLVRRDLRYLKKSIDRLEDTVADLRVSQWKLIAALTASGALGGTMSQFLGWMGGL